MTTHRLPSTWLQDPTDDQMVEKSLAHGGLGSILAGSPLIQRLAKAAATVLVCKSGHETTLGKAEGERCARKDCRAPLMVKGTRKMKDDEEEGMPERFQSKEKMKDDEEEGMPEQFQQRQRRMVKSDDMVETGGSIDSTPILTKRAGNPRRGLWTGQR